ncbi:S1C family serine protease [Taklimakanibacter deserti]|uniref:S1C family serine protease n=1 Tax=Taklimakanibacter deserti TaxID=2267839 RepID=UPI0013C4ED76
MRVRLLAFLVALTIIAPSKAETIKEALASLRPSLKQWVEQTCPRYLGPALWKDCVERQVSALREPKWPDPKKVGQEGHQWILETCPHYLGPSLWRDCAERNISALSGPVFDLKSIDTESRNWIRETCPRYLGPSLWRSCVERQAQALGLEIKSATVPPSIKPPRKAAIPKAVLAPNTQKRKKPTNTQTASLPTWSPRMVRKPSQVNQADPLRAAEIFRLVSPSVYLVVAGRQDGQGEVSQGSAVAVSDNFALTNCHVVAGQDAIALSVNGERFFSVVVAAADSEGDRCILKSTSRLTAIPAIRLHSSLQIGEPVYSIGSPSGLSNTLGEGIVSGLRKHKGLDLVQTSAPISAGSSGGALVDGEGNLVGITTFLLRDTQNLNFAIAAEEYWQR